MCPYTFFGDQAIGNYGFGNHWNFYNMAYYVMSSVEPTIIIFSFTMTMTMIMITVMMTMLMMTMMMMMATTN